MDYETRKRLIFNFLTAPPSGVLLRYKRPAHLSDESARGEINDLVDDLNSTIPTVEKDAFMKILERFKVSIRQMVSSRHWPTIPQAMRAMKEAVEGREVTKAKVVKMDALEVNAMRIQNKEAVGEFWVIGLGADRLLSRGLITNEQLEPYRKYLEESAKPREYGPEF